ncbi:condensation domain-containing protein [Catellatospora methionotrophica]|uniref:condensation domain-containing protein n=1 Tax=Catellatospora methionotrophica TaxID=121620 RepID=UPI0033F72A80
MQTYVYFRGDRAVSAPLTWGQYAIWQAIVALVPGDAVLNLSRSLTVPDRAAGDVARAAAAIGTLISRHESLRTQICDVAGEPRQEVVRAGRLPLTVVECERTEIAETADALARRLAEPRFDYAAGWPVRFGLVVADGRVRQVAFAASHAAVDAYAADIVLRELRVLLLRGSIAALPELQPADLAQRESQTGAKLTARAVEYWLGRYAGMPASMFDPVGPAESPRYRKASLVSPAAQAAVRIIAARHGTSTSTVLLAAVAGLMAAWTGKGNCGLLVIAGNRLQPGHRGLVAPTNQLGLVAVDVDPGEGFAGLLPRVWQAAMRGYRHAYSDPVALNQALEAAGRSHGAETQPYCLFNDVRETADADLAPSAPGAKALLAAREASTLTWPEQFEQFNWRFFLEVRSLPGALDLRLAADTACLPSPQVERFLHAMDRLLVDAALGEATLAELTAAVGGRGPR